MTVAITGLKTVAFHSYVDIVVISCGTEVIARHPRSYERDGFVYDPIHYLPLLERKPGALNQAAPLQAGLCPMSSARCAGLWSPAGDGGANGSSSRC